MPEKEDILLVLRVEEINDITTENVFSEPSNLVSSQTLQ